jgi:hypothetical protein
VIDRPPSSSSGSALSHRDQPLPGLDRWEFIFVIGSSRSGTTWLQHQMALHRAVCTSPELAVFDQYVSTWLQAWAKEAKHQRERRWDRGLPYLFELDRTVLDEFLQLFLAHVYGAVADSKPGATHILDKTPEYSLHVDEIAQLVPRARFIHLIRDGRDVVTSHLDVSRSHGWGHANAARATALWKQYVHAARGAAAYSGRYLEVRYEAMSRRPVDALLSVMEFCGLECTRAEARAIVAECEFDKMKERGVGVDSSARVPGGHFRRGEVASWEDELPLHDRYTVERIAGDLLRSLGYSEDSSWWARSRLQRLRAPVEDVIRRGLTWYRARVPRLSGDR